MAKTYLSAVKYNIIAEFQVEGIVDKPDIIGAIFGQSEGLLGQEMDLKQLQQNGKIGRIEINSEVVEGKTKGSVVIPSSMDMAQTSLLAAAIETVDKVGPFESKIATQKIEDTRNEKRKAISSRAQELLQRFMKEEIPESQELADQLVHNVRTAKMIPYGPEKLAAGPDIDKSDEIIVVEGRADVLNLLKHGVTNVIAMEGSKIPETIIQLAKNKTITAFVDGDRGGELNARHLQEVAKVDFVIHAPDGKEVEELAQKEIVMAMRKKIAPADAPRKWANPEGFSGAPSTDFFPRSRFSPSGRGREKPMGRGRGPPMRGRPPARDFQGGSRPFGRGGGFSRGRSRESFPGSEPFPFPSTPMSIPEPITQLTAEEQQALVPIMKGIVGNLKAKLFDAQMNELAEISVRDLVPKIKETQGVHTIVFDGIITKRLAEEAEALGVQRVVGIKKGWFKASPAIRLLTITA